MSIINKIDQLSRPVHAWTAIANSLAVSAIMRCAAHLRKQAVRNKSTNPMSHGGHGRFVNEEQRPAPYGLENRDVDAERRIVCQLYMYAYKTAFTLSENPYQRPFDLSDSAEFALKIVGTNNTSDESIRLIAELEDISFDQAKGMLDAQHEAEADIMKQFIPEAVRLVGDADPMLPDEIPEYLLETLELKVIAAYTRQKNWAIDSLKKGFTDAAGEAWLLKADLEILNS